MFFARHPEGLALTGGARLAARLSFRLAGRGFAASWEPLGADGGASAARSTRKPLAAGGEHGAGRTARSAGIWQELEGAQPS